MRRSEDHISIAQTAFALMSAFAPVTSPSAAFSLVALGWDVLADFADPKEYSFNNLMSLAPIVAPLDIPLFECSFPSADSVPPLEELQQYIDLSAASDVAASAEDPGIDDLEAGSHGWQWRSAPTLPTIDTSMLQSAQASPLSTCPSSPVAPPVQELPTVSLSSVLPSDPDPEETTDQSFVLPLSDTTRRVRRVRRRPINEPPVSEVLDSGTTIIPTTTKKSTTKVASIPAQLIYPSNLIPHNAPIHRRIAKRSAFRSDLDDDNTTGLSSRTCDVDVTVYEETIFDPTHVNMDELEGGEAKRIRNTLSARRSRARKAAKIDFLEDRVNLLENECDNLQKEVIRLRKQLENHST